MVSRFPALRCLYNFFFDKAIHFLNIQVHPFSDKRIHLITQNEGSQAYRQASLDVSSQYGELES